MIYAHKINKMPELYMIFARKIFSRILFFGVPPGVKCPLSPVFYAYDDDDGTIADRSRATLRWRKLTYWRWRWRIYKWLILDVALASTCLRVAVLIATRLGFANVPSTSASTSWTLASASAQYTSVSCRISTRRCRRSSMSAAVVGCRQLDSSRRTMCRRRKCRGPATVTLLAAARRTPMTTTAGPCLQAQFPASTTSSDGSITRDAEQRWPPAYSSWPTRPLRRRRRRQRIVNRFIPAHSLAVHGALTNSLYFRRILPLLSTTTTHPPCLAASSITFRTTL